MLPPPGEFLWQYVTSTPLAGPVGEIGDDERAALKRDVTTAWRTFLDGDALRLDLDAVLTVTPNARHPEHFAFLHTCPEQNGKDFDDLKIFFTNAFVRCGAEQPKRHVDALERGERYAYLLGHLGERAI
jgi:hypothetical protein